MTLTMLQDAIRYSTKVRMEAIFDEVTVNTILEGSRGYGDLRVSVAVTHRGKRMCSVHNFPIRLAMNGDFYDDYLREKLSTQIGREMLELLMRQALHV